MVVDRRYIARLPSEIESQVTLLQSARAEGDSVFSDLYWQVEPDRVQEILDTSLGDFALFCSEVLDFLEENQDL